MIRSHTAIVICFPIYSIQLLSVPILKLIWQCLTIQAWLSLIADLI